jgi:hypothetical protein
VVAGVVALWLVQEWVVHRWLLHSSWEWPGKAIHKEHHEQPYHHVSLDPPELIIGVMLLAAAVAAVVLGPVGSPVWLTGTATYWLAGACAGCVQAVWACAGVMHPLLVGTTRAEQRAWWAVSVTARTTAQRAALLRARAPSCNHTQPHLLAGLLYEWLHFIVHTRWAPPAGWLGTWLRAVRRHHMLHHLRNESYWLSFSAPAGGR